MVSVFVCDNLYKALLAHNKSEELNSRGFWNINRIPYAAAASEVAAIVDDDYSLYGIENVVIDVDMYEDKTQSLDLIKRVSQKKGYELFVVASNYERKDPLIVAILEEAKISRNNLFTGTKENIIRLLNTSIMKDTEKVSFEVLSDVAAYLPPTATDTICVSAAKEEKAPEVGAASADKTEKTPKAEMSAETFDLTERPQSREKVASIAERYEGMFATKKEPEIQPAIAKRRKELEAAVQAEQPQTAVEQDAKKSSPTRKMLNVVTAAPTARPKTATTINTYTITIRATVSFMYPSY